MFSSRGVPINSDSTVRVKRHRGEPGHTGHTDTPVHRLLGVVYMYMCVMLINPYIEAKHLHGLVWPKAPVVVSCPGNDRSVRWRDAPTLPSGSWEKLDAPDHRRTGRGGTVHHRGNLSKRSRGRSFRVRPFRGIRPQVKSSHYINNSPPSRTRRARARARELSSAKASKKLLIRDTKVTRNPVGGLPSVFPLRFR